MIALKRKDKSLKGIRGDYAGFYNVIQRLRELISINNYTIKQVIECLIKEIDYFSFLKEKEKKDAALSTSRIENVEELMNIASEFDEQPITEELSKLRTFLNGTSLTFSADEQVHSAVTICTIHASKGLEWPFVFIVGADEVS
jgi:DNA helicase-2/ATP-dependent DNA helicase PcrA